MDNFVNMILLSSKRFEWYLNDFAGLVVNGKYENNTDLLVFYELCDKTDFIRISHNEDSICISGSKNGELVDSYITDKNIGFGSYLYYALGLHKKSQEVEMNINEVCRYDGENLWLNGNTTAGLSGSTTYASSSLRMADGTLSSYTTIDEKVSKISNHDTILFEIDSENNKIMCLYVIIGNNLYNFIFKGDELSMDSIGKDMFLSIVNSMEF
jgi:hypothetical protein